MEKKIELLRNELRQIEIFEQKIIGLEKENLQKTDELNKLNAELNSTNALKNRLIFERDNLQQQIENNFLQLSSIETVLKSLRKDFQKEIDEHNMDREVRLYKVDIL